MRRKGYETSEFWFTLVSFIISGLFLSGIISEPETKDDLIDAVTHGVESVILIGGQFMVLSRYLAKRKEEKLAYEKTKQKEADLALEELEDYVGVDKKLDKININTANIAELIQLPHIGPAIAKKIIEYRLANNGIKSAAELRQINGIGVTVLRDIEKYIILS